MSDIELSKIGLALDRRSDREQVYNLPQFSASRKRRGGENLGGEEMRQRNEMRK